ncbi:MAG: ABC transporter substrate-binding protein [Chloroflexi bacterium]|nr:ABC transporter substrate-binding protein [Chloroflexota bacterium]
MGSEIRQPLTENFRKKHGIELVFTIGRSTELIPKVLAQRRAGLFLEDVFLSGISSQVDYKQAGLIESGVDSVLLLPEVTDTDGWMDQTINYVGKDRYAVAFVYKPTITIAVNSELVRPDEMKSYRDLLDPKWKGRIVMQDPTVAGAGNSVMSTLVWHLMGQEYLRELARQEPVITRDRRQQVEWGARGKYPIMIAPATEILTAFVKEGAPLKVIWPIEGSDFSSGEGIISRSNKAQHPAAASVFINWLLTREGQMVFAEASGQQSARVDVVPNWIDPEFRVKPGYKYVNQATEESAFERMKTREMTKEIFASLLK